MTAKFDDVRIVRIEGRVLTGAHIPHRLHAVPRLARLAGALLYWQVLEVLEAVNVVLLVKLDFMFNPCAPLDELELLWHQVHLVRRTTLLAYVANAVVSEFENCIRQAF